MSGQVASSSLTETQICDLLDRAAERRRVALRGTTGEIQSTVDFSTNGKRASSDVESRLPKPYIINKGAVAKLGPGSYQQSPPVPKQDKPALRRIQSKISNTDVKKKITAGTEWFDLPATEMTTELKRDLQLLQMRSVLDPHRHYKKNTTSLKAPPKFSQVGTIIEGPTEFFSARLTNRERKVDLLQEAMNAEKANPKLKGRFENLQVTKQSGGKSYYRKLRSKRLSKGKR